MDKWSAVKQKDAELYQLLKAEPKNYTYGTSGFRYDGELMKPISLRVGLFMDYIAKLYYPDALGVVISASHNPKDDNGLKLINPEGEMLDWKFEACMDVFINTEDLDIGFEVLKTSIDTLFKGKKPAEKGLIFIARDTRKSGPEIQELMTAYATSKYIELGELSTPILYFIVEHYNTNKKTYGESPTTTIAEAYFKTIREGFEYNMNRHFKKKRFNMVIDCANGVGAFMLERFRGSQLFSRYDPVLIYNKDFDQLNVDCGADWVHKHTSPTTAFLQVPEQDGLNNVCFVLDGDADRSIFYKRVSKDSDSIKVVDGSRICVLFARVIAHFLNKLRDNRDQFETSIIDQVTSSKVGVVYTAYSNSAYIVYAKNVLKLDASIAKTGVKFVHTKAKEYDIGIYFEANGHGTIIYNHSLIDLLDQVSSTAKTEEAKLVARDFRNYLVGQNHVNGDAISNILLILASFEILDIDEEDLFTCYVDNHANISMLPLKDRTLMKSTEDERVLAEPADIQPQIDLILKDYPGYIGFVRPSGTEDCCRVYVEGPDTVKIEELEAKLHAVVSSHSELTI